MVDKSHTLKANAAIASLSSFDFNTHFVNKLTRKRSLPPQSSDSCPYPMSGMNIFPWLRAAAAILTPLVFNGDLDRVEDGRGVVVVVPRKMSHTEESLRDRTPHAATASSSHPRQVVNRDSED